jgi:CubicO group peptidase (beta-lactamase class C family)
VTSADVLGIGPDRITVAQLLTHRSGLGPDQTQALMYSWYGSDESTAGTATNLALARARQTAQSGGSHYNTENYAILGEMIAAQTSQSYARYCSDAVIAPAGLITATASPQTGAFLPYGGWQMSAQEYARFYWFAFGPGVMIGQCVPQWPRAVVGDGMDYGMGTFQRASGARYNVWHFGRLCFSGRNSSGAYAVMWMDSWSVVVRYDIGTSGDQMTAVDWTLSAAVFQ